MEPNSFNGIQPLGIEGRSGRGEGGGSPMAQISNNGFLKPLNSRSTIYT